MSSTTQQLAPSGDASGQVLAGCVISIVLTIVFFCLRMFSRWLHEHRFDLSDAFLAASLPITLAIDITMIWCRGPPVGLGHHTTGDPVQFKATMQALLAIECIYTFGLAFIKMSFLVLYLRLFPGKLIHNTIYTFCFIVMAWAVAILFASNFQCRPVAALWTLELRPEATCLPLFNFYIAIWVPNIVTDLVILILPQIYVWKLQVGQHTRIALAGTFLIGAFAIIANVVRFTTFWTIDSNDIEYTLAPLAFWTALELGFATTCACLVTMRPLLMLLFRKTTTWTQRTNGNTTRGMGKRTGYPLGDVKHSDVDRDTSNLMASSTNSHKIADDEILVTRDTFVSRKPRDDYSQNNYTATAH